MKKHKYKVGTVVRLAPGVDHPRCPEGRVNNQDARIAVLLDTPEGGYKMDRDLHGCLYWHEEDLAPVAKTVGELIDIAAKKQPALPDPSLLEAFDILQRFSYYVGGKMVLNAPTEADYDRAMNILRWHCGIPH